MAALEDHAPPPDPKALAGAGEHFVSCIAAFILELMLWAIWPLPPFPMGHPR